MVGVNPGTLSHEAGIEHTAQCQLILLENGIEDMHIIIYETKVYLSASLYKPSFYKGDDVSIMRILFLLTARHVLFLPDHVENEYYSFKEGTDQAKKKVLLMGDAAFEARYKAIESTIRRNEWELEDEDKAAAGRKRIEFRIEQANWAIKDLNKLLVEVTSDWTKKEHHVIGHVISSLPITPNYDNDGFTDDWAVAQIEPSMISRLNFVGNAIDYGSIGTIKLRDWMYPSPTDQPLLKYPFDDLLQFTGTVSDEEMFKPNPMNMNQDSHAVTIVLKRGNPSDLTVGRLDTIRAFARENIQAEPGNMSKQMSVLPRSYAKTNYYTRLFSQRGDSGSAVVAGDGRVCGIITGGDGSTKDHDCAFVTSINFPVKRLTDFQITANIRPLPLNL